MRVHGELRHVVLAHQLLEVRPHAVGALGEDALALVEYLVEDHDALVGQADLVRVRVHEGPADVAGVPVLDGGVELAADVLDRLLHMREQGLELWEDGLGRHRNLHRLAGATLWRNALGAAPRRSGAEAPHGHPPPQVRQLLLAGGRGGLLPGVQQAPGAKRRLAQGRVGRMARSRSASRATTLSWWSPRQSWTPFSRRTRRFAGLPSAGRASSRRSGCVWRPCGRRGGRGRSGPGEGEGVLDAVGEAGVVLEDGGGEDGLGGLGGLARRGGSARRASRASRRDR